MPMHLKFVEFGSVGFHCPNVPANLVRKETAWVEERTTIKS